MAPLAALPACGVMVKRYQRTHYGLTHPATKVMKYSTRGHPRNINESTKDRLHDAMWVPAEFLRRSSQRIQLSQHLQLLFGPRGQQVLL